MVRNHLVIWTLSLNKTRHPPLQHLIKLGTHLSKHLHVVTRLDWQLAWTRRRVFIENFSRCWHYCDWAVRPKTACVEMWYFSKDETFQFKMIFQPLTIVHCWSSYGWSAHSCGGSVIIKLFERTKPSEEVQTQLTVTVEASSTLRLDRSSWRQLQPLPQPLWRHQELLPTI